MTKPNLSTSLQDLASLAVNDPERALALLTLRDEVAKLRLASITLKGFIHAAWHILEPDTPLEWEWGHDAMATHLEKITAGDYTRLIINVPPGSMKSLMVGVFWPAWEWGPKGLSSLKILSTSFKEEHARRDAIKMKMLVESELYQAAFGSKVKIVRGGEGKFEIAGRGWRSGKPIGSLTGDRADRLIIDDPHSTEMGESPAERTRTERLMRESIPTRLNNPKTSAIVLVMQRLHEDDATGVLLEADVGYVHLCLPMRFEPDRRCRTIIGFEDPRTEEGELLFPRRFDAVSLDRLEKAMTPYAVAGQHQQRPGPRAGVLFLRDWFEMVDLIPSASSYVRAWDLAATLELGKNDPDWTVGLKGFRSRDGDIYITDMVRGRYSSAEVQEKLLRSAELDGYSCTIRLPQDPGAAGKSYGEHLKDMLRRFPVRIEPVTGSKQTRALPAVTDASLGKIKLKRASWNQAFIDEVCSFPAGRHDDIVDALSDLHSELCRYGGYTLDNII